MAKRSLKFTFHGAFKSKAKAKRKERRLSGAFIRAKRIQGHRRYVVMTEN